MKSSIDTIRKYLKNKLTFNSGSFYGFEKEKKEISNLLKNTIQRGEANSALIIGQRGSGKTTLINCILNEIQDSDFDKCAVLVRLNGLIHTDDKLALKGITTQLSLENAVDGKVFGSFAENLSFLLACLKTGEKEAAKSIIFILEEFDLFCGHHNQTLLYNLFDIAQSAQTPVCVLGITCRLDVIELFEKRVKSRFSHRQYFLASVENEGTNLHDKLQRIEYLLSISDETDLQKTVVNKWNEHVKKLLKTKKAEDVIQRFLDLDCGDGSLKQLLILITNKLSETKLSFYISDFEEEIKEYEKDDTVQLLMDLSALELCLIIAIKHHYDIYDQPFNFEMILTRYQKFVNANSNIQSVQRLVMLKAFEHLQKLELIAPVTNAGKLQKEYELFKLLVMPHQLNQAVKCMPNLPTEVAQWTSSSILD